MPDAPRPILDYATPPKILPDRWREFVRKSRILSFIFLRPVRAAEIALIPLPMVSVANLILCANEYFLKHPFDLTLLKVLVSGFGLTITGAVLVALVRLALQRKWLVLMTSLLISFLPLPLVGLVAVQPSTYGPIYHVFHVTIFNDSVDSVDYRSDSDRVPKWMNDLPYWKSF